MLRAIVLLVAAACHGPETPPGYQGVVELTERVLSFEVPGRILTLAVDRGDQVEPTRVLATLDDVEQRASVAMREAEQRSAEERAKLTASAARTEELRSAEAQVRGAIATEQLAIKQLQRNLALVAQGAIPQATVDESDQRRKTATSEREALEQRLRELRAGGRTEEVASATAQARAAGHTVAIEADRATRYQLRSLNPGEVLDRHVEVGEVVAAGTPIYTIGDTTHPYVDVFVPQQDIAPVHVGAPATIRVDSLAQPLHGYVEHVARYTEFTPRFIFSRRERVNLVVRVRVRVDDPERLLHAGTPAFVAM